MACPGAQVDANRAVETAVCAVDVAALPRHTVTAVGPELYAFEGPQRTLAGSSTSLRLAPEPYAVVWQLLGQHQLLLQLVDLSSDGGERASTAAVLAFEAALLPAISCIHSEGGVLLAALTADAELHTITLSPAAIRQQGMPSVLAGRGALHRTPLGPQLQRVGQPSALTLLPSHVCIGTDEGNLLCLPADRLSAAAAVELWASSTLGKVLGGLFGRSASQGVLHLLEVEVPGSVDRLLCSIHTGGTMRLWELSSRKLLHSGDLLAPATAAAYTPALARLSSELLDSGEALLLLYLEPSGPAAAGGEGGGAAPGELHSFQIYLEPRGGSDYKVLVEAGPVLKAGIHRLQDLSLELIGAHHAGAWCLYEDEAGQRQLQCVPMAMVDGLVQPATEVSLIEEQVLSAAPQGSLELQEHLWAAVRASLARTGGSSAPAAAALAAALLPAILAPGHLSRPALASALESLGCQGARREAVLEADLTELADRLPAWLASCSRAGGSAGSSSSGNTGSSMSLRAWHALLHAYAAAYQREHAPVALLPQGCPELISRLLVREGGLISVVRPATPAECAAQGSMPHEWARSSVGDYDAVSSLLAVSAQLGAACGGAFLPRLVLACIQQGYSAEAGVLPAVVEALTSASRTAAAAGAAAPDGWYSAWRSACRWLPLQLLRACGSLAEQGRLGPALEGCLAAVQNEEGRGRMFSQLAHVSSTIRLVLLSTAAQVAEAQLQAASQLALALQYMAHNQGWGGLRGAQQQQQQHQLAADGSVAQARPEAQAVQAVEAAGLALWAATSPGQQHHVPSAADDLSADPARMVMSLTLDTTGKRPPKRQRLAPGSSEGDGYVAELLLPGFQASEAVHSVRDLNDLVSLSTRFASHVCAPGAALCLASQLFCHRMTRQLAALNSLLADPADLELLFFKACGMARSISAAPAAERPSLESASLAAFFRLATLVSLPGQPSRDLLLGCLEQLHRDMQGTGAEAQESAEAFLYKAAHLLFQRVGSSSASCTMCMAALGELNKAPAPAGSASAAAAAAAGGQGTVADVASRLHQESRLWASAFSDCLEGRKYAAAYAAALANPEAEVQMDCVHRLAHALCTPGGVPLLCRLPFAHNALMLKGGTPSYGSLMEEVLATLHRRADNLDLTASPQPYQVLYDLYVSRSNYQGAAGAMLSYARRIVQECSADAGMLQRAGEALGVAVSCLRLVPKQEAWLEDPSSAQLLPGQQHRATAGASERPGIVTLAELEREYAVARAHAAAAAAMPSLQATSHAPADIFEHLLTEGLHEAAFTLAEAIYSGSSLHRALRKVFWAAAAACALQQVQGSAGPEGASAVGASWEALERRLLRAEGMGTQGAGMRLVVVDAVLSTDGKCELPPWLVQPFKSEARRDMAGLLRVYMKHNRLADAAALATARLRAASNVPSMTMGSPAADCFPHDLLDVLKQKLQTQAGEQAQRLLTELDRALQRQREAALAQTDAVTHVFA